MISKQLLSEVLWEDDWEINGFKFDLPNEFWISKVNDLGVHKTLCINIYELAHKCKVKASEYGYRMMSCQDKDGGYCEVMEAKHYPPILHSEILDFEYEAVFKCFQWILDNKDNQC